MWNDVLPIVTFLNNVMNVETKKTPIVGAEIPRNNFRGNARTLFCDDRVVVTCPDRGSHYALPLLARPTKVTVDNRLENDFHECAIGIFLHGSIRAWIGTQKATFSIQW
jgi:hypothetical protein